MSDFEIEFGDVEEARPRKALRPDRDGRYAVVAHGEARDGDLAVFVDLDVLRDMEEHALSDTTVELGGVMLGGQNRDEEGHPFVLVEESLRARHYEATKGSFKFTHDTWERISREREALPEDLEMVGWYHTHPDWGVFLSGMDMFICDNFFNRPLDVALVIDPCRRDRGWFFWTAASDRIRRTGGFYVYASRRRQAELEEFVASLEEAGVMPATRYPQLSESTRGGSSGPVVVVPESRSAAWHGPFLASMLFAQTLTLLLLAFAVLGGQAGSGGADESRDALMTRLAQIDEQLHEREALREQALAAQTQLRISAAQLALVDQVVAGGLGGEKLVARLAQAEESVRQLDESNDAFRAERQDMAATISGLQKELTDHQVARKMLVEQSATLREERDKLKTSLARYEKPARRTGDAEGADEEESGWVAWAQANGVWLGISAVMAVALIGGAVALLQYRGETNEEQTRRNPDDEEPPRDRGNGE